MAAPDVETAGGLGYLLYTILRNEFVTIKASHPHQAVTSAVLEALARFFRFDDDASAVADTCHRMRGYFHRWLTARAALRRSRRSDLCAQLRNAARTVLPIASGLDSELWRPSLAKPHFPMEL